MTDAYQRYREMEKQSERPVMLMGALVCLILLAGFVGLAYVMHSHAAAPPVIQPEVRVVQAPVEKPKSIRNAIDELTKAEEDAEAACIVVNNKWNKWLRENRFSDEEEATRKMTEMMNSIVDGFETDGTGARLRNARQHVKDTIHSATMAERGGEIRDRLIRAYGIYGEMVKSSLSPNGSFTNYTEATGKQSSDFRRLMGEIAVLVGSEGPTPPEPGPQK